MLANLCLLIDKLLQIGPEKPEEKKFLEIHFLSDIEDILVALDKKRTEKNKVNAPTTIYNNKMRKWRRDRAVSMINADLKKRMSGNVPISKIAGFCLFTAVQYSEQ